MGHKKEFLPTTRQGRLDMGIVWLHYLTGRVKNEKGELLSRWKLWGISPEIFSDYGLKIGKAQEALAEGKDAEKHTDVINERIKEVFKELVQAMRQMKNRFFHIPPLTAEDFAALLLSVPAAVHIISGDPTAQSIIETFLVGRHQLGIRVRCVSGDPNDRANKGFLIYYKIISRGEKPPENPAELTLFFPEKRKIFTRNFDFGDSGKTVYFCVRIMNGRKLGPWGPMTSALIP